MNANAMLRRSFSSRHVPYEVAASINNKQYCAKAIRHGLLHPPQTAGVAHLPTF